MAAVLMTKSDMRCRILIPAICAVVGIAVPEITAPVATQTDLPAKNQTEPLHQGPLYRLVPDLVLGNDDGQPEWQMFGRGAGVWVEGPSDRIYVLTDDWFIHIVTNGGEHLGKFGGRGHGPGEFESYTEICWIQHLREIWVVDGILRRINRYSEDGELKETVSVQDKQDQWQWLIHLHDGRFLGGRRSYSEKGTTITYYLLNDALNATSEVLTIEPNERWYMEGDIEVRVPFQVPDWVGSLNDGRFVVGRPRLAQLTYYSVEGTPVFVVEGPWTREPVTEADRALWLARVEERRPYALADARKADLPKRHGAFGAPPVVDDTGRLWLSRMVNPWAETGEVVSYRYDVLEPDGTWLGSQELPFSPGRLKIRDQYLYYEDPGDDMVGPRIRRFELVPLFDKQNDALPVSNPLQWESNTYEAPSCQ